MGQGNSCDPAWTRGRSAIVSADHPKYAATRGADKPSHSEIRNFAQQEAIQMSSVLSLRDGIVKAHRRFSHTDLAYYNSRLVEFGGRSIFRHGAVPNATNVHSIVETCAATRDRTMVGVCPAGEASCTYAPGKTECCTPGEQCIQGVGCRC